MVTLIFRWWGSLVHGHTDAQKQGGEPGRSVFSVLLRVAMAVDGESHIMADSFQKDWGALKIDHILWLLGSCRSGSHAS